MDKNIIIPVVSVIMPAFNASKYIQESICSVIAQTYSNWELIIVDDGSTDNTANIILKNCTLDTRIKYFYQENGKQGKARNLGISHSKGKYIAFLDADDIWCPEKLEIQLEEIVAQNVDLVFSDSYIFDNENIFDRTKRMHTANHIFKGEDGLKLFLTGNKIPILTVLTKKEKIALVANFSEILTIQNAEDYHLWLKMLLNDFVFYGSEKILTFYREHDESATSLDKFAGKQLPNVFANLIQNYPKKKTLFYGAMKKVFKKRYNNTVCTKSDFYLIINENCRYLDKQFYAPFYKTINYFFGPHCTKKFLNRFLNA